MDLQQSIELLKNAKVNPLLLFKVKGRRDVEFNVNMGKWNVQGSETFTFGDTFDFIQWISVYGDSDPN